MGHVFQVECWARHPKGCSFGVLWLSKLAKAMVKALERKNAIFGTYLFIFPNGN